MKLLRLWEDDPLGPYEIERVEVPDEDAGDQQCSAWWRSKLTRGIVALVPGVVGDKVRALFLRPDLDRPRVPPEWTWFGTNARGSISTAELTVVDQSPAPAPLWDDVEPPKPMPHHRLDSPKMCGCCGEPKMPTDEGRDRSPSGRLADGRCMACGHPLVGMRNRDIEQMYRAYLRG